MCIAIMNSHRGADLNRKTIERCARKHPDGMSLMWFENEEIKMFKTLDCVDHLYAKYRQVRDMNKTIALHFRRATHGEVSLKNCHPFWINRDMAFVHNGVIRMNEMPEDRVDTKVFRDKILRPYLDPAWAADKDARDMVGDYISPSKLVVATANPEPYFYIVNQKKGFSEGANWFSNTSYRVSNENKWHPHRRWKENKKKNKNKSNRRDEGKEETRTSHTIETDLSDLTESDNVDIVEGGYLAGGDMICDECLSVGISRSGIVDLDKFSSVLMTGYFGRCSKCQSLVKPRENLNVA